MSKILITGGAGFIGSSLSIKLINLGHDVVVLDNLSKQIHGENPNESFTFNKIKNKVEFIHGSVEKVEDWLKSLNDIEFIVHLAAETGTGQSMYEITKYTDVNIRGTSIMLELLANKKFKVNKIVYASSRAVYGEGKYLCGNHGEVYPFSREDNNMKAGDFSVKCPICNKNVKLLSTDENSSLKPSSVYGFTKQAQEQLCEIVCNSLNIPNVGLRFQNVYGPGQSLNNPYTGILSIFSNLLLSNKNINIFEDGEESRDFVYIEDVVNSIVLALFNIDVNKGVFNVGSGEKTSVLNVAEELKRIYNSTSRIDITGNYRIGDIRHNIADLTKSNNMLGYFPSVNFSKGISAFSEWVKGENIGEIKYDKSFEEMKVRGLLK